MSRHVFKLPDLGEGTVEAEIVAWRVKPGDMVAEDDVIVEVMTDKAAVEVPSPVSGKVVATHGNAGESVPVGSELIVFETQPQEEEIPRARSAEAPVAPTGAKAAAVATEGAVRRAPMDTARTVGSAPRHSGNGVAERTGRVATSPAIRRRAHEAGIDLSQIRGTGPNGRIVRE